MGKDIAALFSNMCVSNDLTNKTILSDFILRESSGSVPIYKEPTNYLGKVIRNLKDKRFYCINPIDVFKLRRKEYKLPGIHRILYRYYRNYLSYAASKTLRIIMDDINND